MTSCPAVLVVGVCRYNDVRSTILLIGLTAKVPVRGSSWGTSRTTNNLGITQTHCLGIGGERISSPAIRGFHCALWRCYFGQDGAFHFVCDSFLIPVPGRCSLNSRWHKTGTQLQLRRLLMVVFSRSLTGAVSMEQYHGAVKKTATGYDHRFYRAIL